MVDFPINVGIRKIGDQITIPIVKGIDVEWFAEDITVLLSATDRLATLVVDFAFSVSTVVEYTLDSGANWIAFNNGEPVVGGQSRFIDVTTGVLVNFREKTGGTLIRCIVSSVP
jgi:hypothetical protein